MSDRRVTCLYMRTSFRDCRSGADRPLATKASIRNTSLSLCGGISGMGPFKDRGVVRRSFQVSVIQLSVARDPQSSGSNCQKGVPEPSSNVRFSIFEFNSFPVGVGRQTMTLYAMQVENELDCLWIVDATPFIFSGSIHKNSRHIFLHVDSG